MRTLLFSALPILFLLGCNWAPFSSPSAGSPVVANPVAIPTPTPSPTPAAHLFDLYYASQTTTASKVAKLRYDSNDDSISLTSTTDVTSSLVASGIRYFIDLASGGFLIGGYDGGTSIFTATINPLTLSSTQTLSGRGAGELSDYLGGCQLANGHIIAGSYGNQLAAEYDSSRTYLRDLPAMSFFLSDCASTSDSANLFVSDYDANSDSAGFIRKFTFAAGSWTQTASVDISNFNGESNGSPYSVLLNSNGNLYISPQNPSVGGVRKIIRCLNANLASCAEIGANWPVDYPNGAVEGVVQIPNTNDMLFIDNSSIYRYKVSDDTMTAIYTLAIPAHQWTRGMRIRTAP